MKLLKLRQAEFICFLSSFIIFIFISTPGYFKYLIFIILSFIYIFLSQKNTKLRQIIIVMPYIFYVLVGVFSLLINKFLINGEMEIDIFCFLRQIGVYFVSCLFSISFSLYFYYKKINYINVLFFSLCFFWICTYSRYLSFSNFYYESQLFAYAFGLFSVYYFYRRMYKYALIALIFTILEHKRIATYGLLMVIPLIYISQFEKIKRFFYNTFFVFLLLLPITYVIVCKNGLLKVLFSSLKINTYGRLEGTTAWDYFLPFYEISFSFVGNGLGAVLSFLSKGDIFAFANLHNDFLAAYIELGFWGFIGWLISFNIVKRYACSLYKKNLINLLIGYSFILFLTDNVFIYISFIFPSVCLLFYIISSDSLYEKI